MEFNQFFAEFWLRYPNDLCQKKKGAKFAAQKAAEKLKPEQYQYVLNCMDALIKHDRQDNEAYRWPHASTWSC